MCESLCIYDSQVAVRTQGGVGVSSLCGFWKQKGVFWSACACVRETLLICNRSHARHIHIYVCV